MEKDQNGGGPKWKMTKKEDNINMGKQIVADARKKSLKLNQRSEIECGPA